MRFIFLDLDDTILDFHQAERQALSRTLGHFRVDPTPAVLDRYHELNRQQWELLEEGKLTQPQVLEETRLLMERLDSPGSVFRMNHASNYLVLKGTLNRDKEAMLRTIDAAEHDLSRLRPEEWRGL